MGKTVSTNIKVSLDLTAACRVHLLEPQWNPAAEEQALDRVHRMGQTREVIALRYIVDKSIENVQRRLFACMISWLLTTCNAVRYVVPEKEVGTDRAFTGSELI